MLAKTAASSLSTARSMTTSRRPSACAAASICSILSLVVDAAARSELRRNPTGRDCGMSSQITFSRGIELFGAAAGAGHVCFRSLELCDHSELERVTGDGKHDRD